MTKALHSPWFSVALAIVIMTIGYTVYLDKNGVLASTSNYYCPIQDMCKKEGCTNEEACSNSECNGCPYCLNEAS
ncbi:MAG: hypothetical protein O3A81_04115 [bacterium]|nr:hypothetical protein [bacterium]